MYVNLATGWRGWGPSPMMVTPVPPSVAHTCLVQGRARNFLVNPRVRYPVIIYNEWIMTSVVGGEHKNLLDGA